MKKVNKIVALALCATLFTFPSCDKADDTTVNTEEQEQEETEDPNALTDAQSSLLNSYAYDIIVARYTQLATDGKTLLEAAQAIQESTDADKTDLIATAAEAWEAARISWERTEAYLFGPVDKAGIDPGIDSWPLVLPDLQDKIQNWDDSDNYLAADGGDLKGFHAIEYVLFADGDPKATTVTYFGENSDYAVSQGSLTDEQFEDNIESYLVAVCNELYRCVTQLEAEWDYDGLSSERLADMENFDPKISLNTAGGDYAAIFVAPSLDNAYYSSFNACIGEALLGAIGIADEVANVKIADPINADIEAAGQGLLEVESWFSHNSISDFTNNVRGIKEAFFGELCEDEDTFDADTEPASNSIAALLAENDAAAYATAVAAMNDAIAAVKAMPAPFRDNLTWSSENAAAQLSVAAVQEALEAAYVILLNQEVPEDDEE